jgi:hypothetical protein
LHFPENLGTLFNLHSVGPYDSCFDHQQIDNHRVRHLVPEIADLIAELAIKAFCMPILLQERLRFFSQDQ